MNGWAILGCSIAGGIIGKHPTVGFILGGFGVFTILMVAGAWNGTT